MHMCQDGMIRSTEDATHGGTWPRMGKHTGKDMEQGRTWSVRAEDYGNLVGSLVILGWC